MTKELRKNKYLIFLTALPPILLLYFVSYHLTPQLINCCFDPTSTYWLINSDQKPKYILANFSVLVTLLYLFYFLSNSILGLLFLSIFNGYSIRYCRKFKQDFPLILMCYPLGSIIFIFINRVITLLFINKYSIFIIIIINLLLVLSFFTNKLSMYNTKFIHKNTMNNISPANLIALFFSIILIILLLHFPDQHIFGDGVRYTFEIIDNDINFYGTEKLPLIAKHYDEILFLYPLIALVKYFGLGQNSILLIFWFHYSFIKIGCFFLLISAAKSIGLSLRQSVLLALVCFFSNPHINPFRLKLIFDSNQPVAYSLHPGRVIIDTLIIYFTSIILRNFITFKINIKSTFLLSLFSMGLGSLSISSGLIFLGVVSAIFSKIFYILKNQFLLLMNIIIYGFLITSLFLEYEDGSFSYFPLIISILLSTFIFGYLFIGSLTSNRSRYFQSIFIKNIISFAVMILSYSFSLNFLGNILIGQPKWPTRFGQRIIGSNIEAKEFGLGIGDFCQKFPFSCSNISDFVEAYGLPYMLCSILLLFLLFITRQKIKHNYMLNNFFHLLFLSITLFLFVFMNEGVTEWLEVWVKSRLPEPLFYSSIFFTLASLYKLSHQYQFLKILNIKQTVSVIDIYVFTILVASFISQSYYNVFLANFNYLLNLRVHIMY